MRDPFVVNLFSVRHASDLETRLIAHGYACRHPASIHGLYALDDESCIVIDLSHPLPPGQDRAALMPQHFILPTIYTGHLVRPTIAAELIRAGAIDFLELPLSMTAFDAAVGRAKRRLLDRSRLARLSEREREILPLLAQGHPNKVIAAKLGISARTVEVHRARLMEKTSARSFAELVSLSISSGLISVIGAPVASCLLQQPSSWMNGL